MALFSYLVNPVNPANPVKKHNMPHDYIFFADDRSSIPTSTMHIADQIAKNNRVFWVNIYTHLCLAVRSGIDD